MDVHVFLFWRNIHPHLRKYLRFVQWERDAAWKQTCPLSRSVLAINHPFTLILHSSYFFWLFFRHFRQVLPDSTTHLHTWGQLTLANWPTFLGGGKKPRGELRGEPLSQWDNVQTARCQHQKSGSKPALWCPETAASPAVPQNLAEFFTTQLELSL